MNKKTKLTDLFSDLTTNEEKDFYYKMFFIELDILKNNIDKKDYLYFKANFNRYIELEKKLIIEVKIEDFII